MLSNDAAEYIDLVLLDDHKYLALYTGDPGPSLTNNELVGDTYARQEIVWDVAPKYSRDKYHLYYRHNIEPIIFSIPLSDLGSVTYWGLLNDIGEGFAFGQFSQSVNWKPGHRIVFTPTSFNVGFLTSNLTRGSMT